MYAVTSIDPEMRTRATLRRAELGFFGVVVYTRVHTPRRCGAAVFFLRPLPDFSPGVATFFLGTTRPLRTSCEVVGIRGDASSARRPAGRRLHARVRASSPRLPLRAQMQAPAAPLRWGWLTWDHRTR